MDDLLRRVEECRWYSVSKDRLSDIEEVMNVFGDSVEVEDKGDTWLVSAESKINDPAKPDDIKAIEELYKCSLPDDYRGFLLTTNGADLFIHPQRRVTPPICRCSILSTQTILSLYSQFFEAMKIWILGELPGRLHYIPIADVTNGSYIAMSTNPEFPYKIFRMYYGSGYVPYTAKDRGTGSHYSTIYSQSFSEWLEKVLDTYGAFGIDA